MVNLLAGFGIADWIWDILALVITFVMIMLLIRINDMLRKREIIPIYVSRKVIHTFAGPVFLICWLLFSSGPYSRYLAAIVPLIFVLLFAGIGSGAIKNEEFVRTMSRSGKASELLKGTLFYALVMVICSIFLWYVPYSASTLLPVYNIFVPTVFLIFGPLAGGDGLADMIGRKWGKHKYKVFAEKSVEGSLAMFFFSILFTYGLLSIYWIILNPLYPAISLIKPLIPTLIIALVATIVEAISPKNVDNLLIPLVTFIVIYALWLIGFYPYLVWNFFPVP